MKSYTDRHNIPLIHKNNAKMSKLIAIAADYIGNVSVRHLCGMELVYGRIDGK